MQTKRQKIRILPRLYNLFNSFGSSRKNGFTLVELLIVIVVGLIITAGVLSIMWVYVFDFEQTDDITAARQRGEMVLSILEGPILHAGLGMPNSGGDFEEAFASGDNVKLGPVLSWDSSVEIVNSNSLFVCYATPSIVFVDSQDSFDKDTEFTISITDDFPANSIVEKTNMSTESETKNWVVIPTGNTPFLITGYNSSPTSTMTLKPFLSGSGLVAQFDQIHYVRALYAKVDDGKFKTWEIVDSTSNLQPRVDGVEQIYFELENGVISVYVLTRGNKKDVGLDNPRPIPGWPSGISIDNESYKYRLSVTKGSWRIRN